MNREEAPTAMLVASTWRVLGYGNFPSGIFVVTVNFEDGDPQV